MKYRDGDIKQVLVVNMEVPFPVGRMAAQVSHATELMLINQGRWDETGFHIDNPSPELKFWMQESFTDVVVKVWGKKALAKLREECEKAGIPTNTMEEEGWETVMSIGPAHWKTLLPITRDLPLW